MNDYLELVYHSSKWQYEFEKEANLIKEVLGDSFVEIYHIGSTAVEGLKSKPIIDILAVVSSIDKLDSIESSFHNLGYESKGEHGIKDRRFCVKREDNKRKVHLHMYELNHAEIERHVKFRDILRENASIRIDYEVLKKNLLEQFQENRVQYTEGKTEFINRILNKNG